MNTYPYRTYAEIDLNKMQHNLRQVRAAIGPDCKLLFVLKADAYGHGTPVCAKYSEELVDWYAVATIDEALSIRRAGVEKPILLFGALQDPEIELAADNRITINSCSLEYSRHVAEVLQRCGKRMDCLRRKKDERAGLHRIDNIVAAHKERAFLQIKYFSKIVPV